MRRVLILSILLVVLVGGVFSVLGQDDEVGESCEGDGLAEFSTALSEFALTIPEDPEGNVMLLSAALATWRAECSGNVFTSDEYGVDVVTDPILFENGTYRVTLDSAQITTVSTTTIEGDCGFMNLLSVIDLEGGSDSGVWELEDCVMLLDIDGNEEWTLTMELLVPGD